MATAIGVGAHQSHLQATHRLSGPVACAACHVVPDDVASPGHIDAERPAEVVLAGWDRNAATCVGVSCHGQAVPRWTAPGTGQAACGTCHGIPPADGLHASTLTLGDCAACHSSSVDAFGNIIVTGLPGAATSTHIDGVVDAP
jgi:predicted CxxxxCH...CXXCH cytochrome family protein